MIPMIKKSICRLLLSTFLLALWAPFTLAGQGAAMPAKTAAPISADEQKAAAQLKAETISEVTTKLASAEMAGRGVGQLGGDRAAKYIVEQFARIGLKPLGNTGSYLQAIPFRINNVLPESSLKVGDMVFKFKSDFIFDRPDTLTSRDASGGLVFAGYGVVSDELKRNDLAGLDVKGKVVMLLSGRPKNVDAAVWNKTGNLAAVFDYLVKQGATGILLAVDSSYDRMAAYGSRRQVSLSAPAQRPVSILPAALISNSTADKILATLGKNYAQVKQDAEAGEFVSHDMKLQTSIAARTKLDSAMSSNVIGYIEGSDKALKSEALLYTAHYDAYGKDFDGTVYPGAGDNAVGVAKMIAIAEVFAQMKPKPRRSIIFIALTGEEYGLLGAEFWTRFPTWPLPKVAASINYDGIGTDAWGKLGVLVDYGFKHSDLGDLIQDVASASNIAILPDPQPQERVFYRSDHYVFYKRGIPALYLLGLPKNVQLDRVLKWMATSYHMPTDTIQPDWDWEGSRTLASLGLIAGMRIANQATMPAWKTDSPYNRPRGTNLPPPPQR